MKFICVYIILLFACKGLPKENHDICSTKNFYQEVEKVSLKDIQKINQLDGKLVEIEGILSYEFEDVAIYPSKTADPPEGMWLDLRVPASVPERALYALNGKKIAVIGRVNLKRKGHFGGYIGTLDSAFCIKLH